jgi:hypothetical protein
MWKVSDQITGRTKLNNFVTMVATPLKWVGLCLPLISVQVSHKHNTSFGELSTHLAAAEVAGHHKRGVVGVVERGGGEYAVDGDGGKLMRPAKCEKTTLAKGSAPSRSTGAHLLQVPGQIARVLCHCGRSVSWRKRKGARKKRRKN